jgi:23S rRNA (guanosine2251-2'-O)-methyltransferase
MKQNKIYIYGKHVVMEALEHAPGALNKVFLAPNVHDKELLRTIKSAGISMDRLGSGKKAEGVTGSDAHQGIVGRVSLVNLVRPYEQFIRELNISPDTSLVLLGEIKDPQNVGAIIRSAAAFGVSGILMPKHNQAPITGAVVKVSAGMVFRVPIVETGNVNMTIRDLKDRGFRVYGLEGKAPKTVSDVSYSEPSVFILGSEAKGLKEKTSELCDELVSVPINACCESLNVAASGAVVLYAWSRQHVRSLK